MILVLDNYDSFTYNLVQLVRQFESDVRVFRNDVLSPENAAALHPDKILLSPGPGHPSEAGYTEAFVRYFTGLCPVLGICLGHQAIAEAYGGTITHSKRLMHGKQSRVYLSADPLFSGLDSELTVGRYHSLSVDEKTLPERLKVIARDEDGTIMGIRHRQYPVYGLQFHPESILTPDGPYIIENFCRLAGACGADERFRAAESGLSA